MMTHLFCLRRKITIFTIHRNLIFLFQPTAIEPSLGLPKVLKVLRWALLLSTFSYRISHELVDQNIMAAIMTRWLRGYGGRKPRAGRLTAAVPVAPKNWEDDWPTRAVIISER